MLPAATRSMSSSLTARGQSPRFQLAQIGQPLSQIAQLRIVETARHLFAISAWFARWIFDVFCLGVLCAKLVLFFDFDKGVFIEHLNVIIVFDDFGDFRCLGDLRYF